MESDGDIDLVKAKDVVKDIWADFTDSFDAREVIDKAYSKRIISETTRDKMMQAKDRKEATRCFLIHLENSATIDTLWKVHTMLQESSKDHDSYKRLCEVLSNSLPSSKQRHHLATKDSESYQRCQPSCTQASLSAPISQSMNRGDCDLVDSRESRAVVALDLSKSKLSYSDRLFQACPPDRRLKHAFHKMLIVATKILNGFIDCLKPMLRDLKASNQWPFDNLLLEDIDGARSMSDIFTIISIEKCWLNTEVLIHLVNALPPKAAREAIQCLEDYNCKLGKFTCFVLAKHVPADELACGGTQAVAQMPNLFVTYDEEYESFTVADLLEHQKFLRKTFGIPSKQFQYIESKATQSILVVWALLMPSSQAFCILDKAKMTFWQLKEHRIIKLEIEGMFQLCLRGNHLPYFIKKGFQWNQDFIQNTQGFSRQFLALVDFESIIGQKGTLHSPLKERRVRTSDSVSTVDSLDVGIHRHGESEASEHEKLEILSPDEDLSELEVSASSEDSEVQSGPFKWLGQSTVATDPLRIEQKLGYSSRGTQAQVSKYPKFKIPIDRQDEMESFLQACAKGDLPQVIAFLSQGYSPNETDHKRGTPLTIAAREGRHKVVSQLITSGANVDEKDMYGGAALHYASVRGHLKVVEALLNAGAKINEVATDHSTSLMLAARGGHHKVVSYLIGSGANVDEKDRYGKTALHYASVKGHLKVVETLLNAGAKIDEVATDHSTPLMLAAREGHHKVVNGLVASGANVDEKEGYGRTALHMASERGHLKVVEELLNAGAKIDEVDTGYSTPLMLAARGGHHKVVSCLVISGTNVNNKAHYNRTALHHASMRGHLKVVKVLLDAGSEIDKEDGDYSTALILAIKEGYYNIANYLITSGASVVKKDRNGWTALLYATKMGHLETVKAIVEAGAEIDDMSRDHFTPLMLAVRTKQIPIIVYLLESGADITKQDKSGLTRKSEVGRFSRKADTQLARGKRTLSYAINHRHRSAAKVLITHGVSIEGLLSTSPPMTALMWTAQEGDDSLTEELILQGVNVNYQNPDGRTALHFAALNGLSKIAKILLDNGAEIDLEDNQQCTPLVLSVEVKKYDAMLHLITSGADVTQLAKHPDKDLGKEALSYAVNCGLIDIAKGLIAKGVGIEGLLITSPPITALMWTAQEGYDSLTNTLILQGVNINYQNPDGHTALHFSAANNSESRIAQILLNNGAEIDLEDKHHLTPLVLSVEAKKYDVMLHLITSGADVTQLVKHPDKDLGREVLLYAINNKNVVAKVLITKGICIKELLNTSPPMTALMLTAQEGYDSLTKQLILQGVNVNYQNPDDYIALHFAAQYNHIQCGILLVEAGANVSIVNKASQTPLDLSNREFKEAILQTLSFQTKKTVCVIGNAMSGKSTLIASLQNENASFVKKVRNRLFGVRNISERTAGIEPVSLSSKRYGDVMFFDFAGEFEYHGPHEMFLESILSEVLSTLTIILVVKATEKESDIWHQLNRWLHPFSKMSSSTNPVRVIVVGSHMDKVKRKAETKEKLELCYRRVKDSLHDAPMMFKDLCYLNCRQPYSSDISKLCAYLQDVPPPKYKDVHIGYSIPWVISRIRSSIDGKVISMSEFSDWIAHNTANLPTNLPPAEEVCKDLSSTGHFLYLPSKKEGTSNGWLVLDLPSILHEVYGTLFSPSKKIVNKFGLLNCQHLSVLFPTLNPSMIHDVLISLEICVEVDPSILSEAIHHMDSSDEGGEHLFFPALVSASSPEVFTENCKGNHILCWQLEVIESSFLSSRLLQTIILRLVTNHVLCHKQGFQTREHYCSVWWNGIFWQSIEDVDIAVQISDNAVVQVIGRSAVSPEGLCMYMSRVIQDIFATIRTLSPDLSGSECMIHPVHPQALLEGPRSPSPQEMFPVEFILESRRNGGSRCLSCNAVDKIAEEKNISDVFGGFQPSVDVVERFSMSTSPPPPTTQSTGSTTSTNPLPTASSDPLSTMLDDPLRTTPTDPLLNTSGDPLSKPSKADSDPLPTTSSDPLKTTPTNPLLTTPTINELQRLIIRHIALDWQSIGVELDIKVSVLNIIEADVYPRSVERCCRTMFTRWLACDEDTGGEPRVWRTVLKALKNAGYMTLVGDVERTLFEQK